jgi:hypothetical protein
MTDKEVIKKMYQLLLTEPHAPTLCDQLESIAREALAQPEQEPVAILNHAHGVHTFRNVNLKGLPDGEYLVYTHPPQRTEQEPVAWAKFLHYPECWDTAAYPTLHDAIHEALAWSGCSVCTPPAQPEPVQEPVACFIGAKGSAFDSPETKRAYTYKEQPGNAVASRLGRACDAAIKQRAGDNIDRGLSLLQELQKERFGVFSLGAEYTTPPQRTEENFCSRCGKRTKDLTHIHTCTPPKD